MCSVYWHDPCAEEEQDVVIYFHLKFCLHSKERLEAVGSGSGTTLQRPMKLDKVEDVQGELNNFFKIIIEFMGI